MLDCLRREIAILFCSAWVRLSEMQRLILNHIFRGHLQGWEPGRVNEKAKNQRCAIWCKGDRGEDSIYFITMVNIWLQLRKFLCCARHCPGNFECSICLILTTWSEGRCVCVCVRLYDFKKKKERENILTIVSSKAFNSHSQLTGVRLFNWNQTAGNHQ